MCPHASQTTSKCGLSDQMSGHIWLHSHLYLVLTTCDLITQDGWWMSVSPLRYADTNLGVPHLLPNTIWDWLQSPHNPQKWSSVDNGWVDDHMGIRISREGGKAFLTLYCQTEQLLNCSNLVLSDTQIPGHVGNLDTEELWDGIWVLFFEVTRHSWICLLVIEYKWTTTDLELSPILTDVVLLVCVQRLSILQPGDDWSRVSFSVTVEDHSAVDHCSHLLHELLQCSRDHRRDWGGKTWDIY